MKIPMAESKIILQSEHDTVKVGIPAEIKLISVKNFIPIYKGKLIWNKYKYSRTTAQGREYVYGGVIHAEK